MIIGDVILIRSRKPWRMLLSTDPSDNDSDRGCIRVLNPPSTKLLRMGLDQELGDVDPAPHGHARVVHRI
jgi:hypothetical protein